MSTAMSGITHSHFEVPTSVLTRMSNQNSTEAEAVTLVADRRPNLRQNGRCQISATLGLAIASHRLAPPHAEPLDFETAPNRCNPEGLPDCHRPAPPHVSSTLRLGYSSAGCSPAEPASASPSLITLPQLTGKRQIGNAAALGHELATARPPGAQQQYSEDRRGLLGKEQAEETEHLEQR